MNYSLLMKRCMNWPSSHVVRRGVSYSWLLLPRNQTRILLQKTPLSGLHVQNFRPKRCILFHESRSLSCHAGWKQINPQSLVTSSTRSFSQDNEKKNETKKLGIAAGLVGSGLLGGLWYMMFYKQRASPEKPDYNEERKDGPAKLVKYPDSSEIIPDKIPYLLIGAGTASFSAFRAIKAIDPLAKVLMITNEAYYPYMRPPLSKELILSKSKNIEKELSFIQWDGSERSVYYEPEEFYLSCQELMESETGGVSVARGWKVSLLNPELKYVILEGGKRIYYDKCLLATGAVPKNLPVFLNNWNQLQNKVSLYRNLDHYLEIENVLKSGAKSIAIVGGGFSGSELASALARKGLNVIQIFKENSNMAQVLPDYLSKSVSKNLENQGVKLRRNTEIKEAKVVNSQVQLTTNINDIILADHVIVAAGVEPNTSLASSAGLEVDKSLGGFVVNTELEARSGLYAAGDCACFYDPKLGRRRVEHHDHAVVSGRLAGENMAGAAKGFNHQSMFWSDLGPGLGYEAIGIVDSKLPTVSVFLDNSESPSSKDEKNGNISKSEETPSQDIKSANNEADELPHKGIIFYLKNEEVVGMIMWNLYNRIDIARQVLKSNVTLKDLKEAAKLFKIPGKISE